MEVYWVHHDFRETNKYIKYHQIMKSAARYPPWGWEPPANAMLSPKLWRRDFHSGLLENGGHTDTQMQMNLIIIHFAMGLIHNIYNTSQSSILGVILDNTYSISHKPTRFNSYTAIPSQHFTTPNFNLCLIKLSKT